MTLISIALRCLVAYAYLLVMLRLPGKRAITRATPLDFVIGLVLGDLVDNAIWGSVPQSEFFVAVAALLGTRLLVGTPSFDRRGSINRARE
jgi:uncharacterized membrane protein YcaP (DUF421 family)